MLAADSDVLSRKIPVRHNFVQNAEPSLARMSGFLWYSMEYDATSSSDLCLALPVVLAAGDTASIRHSHCDFSPLATRSLSLDDVQHRV